MGFFLSLYLCGVVILSGIGIFVSLMLGRRLNLKGWDFFDHCIVNLFLPWMLIVLTWPIFLQFLLFAILQSTSRNRSAV